MTAPTNTAIIIGLYAQQMQPDIVEEREGVTYIGYAAPGCLSETDPKWSIKRIYEHKDDAGVNTQHIEYAEGSNKFKFRWSERANLSYKINKYFKPTEMEP